MKTSSNTVKQLRQIQISIRLKFKLMSRFRFKFKVKNLDPIDKLFMLSMTKPNEIYLIPPIPRTPSWVNSGLHISFHASGRSHMKMNLPISCLNRRIEHKLSFNRSDLIDDII